MSVTEGGNGPLTKEELEEASILTVNANLKSHGLVHQQIASYNYFVKIGIPTIVINSEKTYSCRKESKNKSGFQEVHTLEFLRTKIQDRMVWTDSNGIQHKLTPYECRLRDLTYSVDLWADVRKVITSYDENGKEQVDYGKICSIKIGQVPVMVKSDVCMLKNLSDNQLCGLKEDPNDPGGYFIVSGKEKVLIAQDRAAVNQPFVFKPMCDSKYQYEAEIRSSWSPVTDKICATWIRLPLPQSGKDVKHDKQSDKGGKKLVEVLRGNMTRASPGLVATIPKCRKDIPLIILYRALNFSNDKEIWKTLCLDNTKEQYYDMREALGPTFHDPHSIKVKTQKDALLFIGKYSAKQEMSDKEKQNLARDILSREVLPHVGKTPKDDWLKGYHIGERVCKLMNVMVKGDECDDRDHLKNKRLDIAGPLMTNLFKTLFKNLQFTSKLLIDRKIEHRTPYEACDVIKWDIIEKGMNYALASGNWGDKRKTFSVRSGVSQLLNRLNHVATLSHLRRVHSPVNRLVRMTPPRHLHNTFYGILCPAETPEGEQVGLVKNLSAMAYISVENVNDERMALLLEDMGTLIVDKDHLGEINTEHLTTSTKVYVNGLLIGCHKSPVDFITEFRKIRRSKNPDLPGEASIFYDQEMKEIHIRTDAGRAMRPLFVVEDRKLVLNREHIRKLKDPNENYGWENLLEDGVVEMLDTAEVENCFVAMFPEKLTTATYTHCEIDPAMMLGICANLIPYSNHNQSPRNTYQSAMSKQAIGFPMSNYRSRYDPSTHVLYYPQKPLVTTKGNQLCKYDENPCGINAIVAIATYHGYNQEDSLIFNKSSLDRGMFRSLYYKTYHEDEINKEAGREERFEKFVRRPREAPVPPPDEDEFDAMEDDGLRLTGSELFDGDIVIGKTKLLKNGDIGYVEGDEAVNKRDASVMHRSCTSWSNTKEIIDSTVLMDNADGYRSAKVRIRSTRIPQIGDKFASRHGQKGVIGMTYTQEDMMFTKDGITPDIILNPHAIPSRMTIGHLIETLVGKASCLSGKISDGTPFGKKIQYTDSELAKLLEEHGFQALGNEVLYVGCTGRKMHSTIFIGPAYYQRLKHMTEDKLHIRGRGPMAALCRQPLGGINRDGGLRFGEMERDCTISHGIFRFLQERLMTVSDAYTMTVCNICGYISDRVPSPRVDREARYLKCRRCRSQYGGSSRLNLPYAAKTFFQELMAMNIRVGLMVTETDIKPPPATFEDMAEGWNGKLDPDDVISGFMNEVECVGFVREDTGEDDFRKEKMADLYAQYPKGL